MSVTSVPVGTTGQSLEGWEVNGAVRESVTLTDPSNPDGAAQIVSTQPIDAYGLPVWVQGTPNVGIAGTVVVTGNASSFVTNFPPVSSSFVVNASNPVSSYVVNFPAVSSTFAVNNPAVASTFVVNTPNPASTVVVSSVPHALVGTSQVFGQVSSFPIGVSSTFAVNNPATVSTQIVSSIPFLITGTTMVNIVSTVTQNISITSSIPLYAAQSSAPWLINGSISVSSQVVASSWPLSTTMVNIVSSTPQFVAQSSAPWRMVIEASTATNMNALSSVLLATLNTTVVRNGPAALYGYQISNFASTSLYVKLANASSAVVASTAAFRHRIGLAPSTTVYGSIDQGIAFSTGITMFTTRNAWDTDLTAPLGSTAVVNLMFG